MDRKSIEAIIKDKLSPSRFEHTQAVMRLAVELANHYDIDQKHAEIAALIHDITKEQSMEEQLHMLSQSDIIMDTIFYNNNLLHGITAYLYAKDTLNIDNMDILNAIRYHTTARENMSMLEKIIYVADACSYDRTYHQVKELRELSFENIDDCIIKIIEFTVNSLLKKRMVIASDAISCYNAILLCKEKFDEKDEK